MTTLPPQVAMNGLYGMTDAARVLGITRNTLRKYAERGYIAFRVRKSNRRRVTTGKEIIKLWNGR